MPIYEYRCLGCGAQVEKMQKVSDEPLKTCEKCGGELEKQVSLSGFQFKGAGWYVTDYAGKSKEADAAKSEKTKKTETSEKGEKTEKTSASESTAAPEPASKQASDTATSSKNDADAKKD